MSDWVKIMRSDLEKSGIETKSLQTDQEISLAFWNMHHRRIQTRPRTVHVAREFVCPPEHVAAVDALKGRLARGDDVNRSRSSAALNPKQKAFNDRLLNDWGVQHLHLGPDNPGAKLSGRSGHCLYVYFTGADAYFLDVMAHDNYEKQELMLRLHRNWPEVIAEHRARGVVHADTWDDSDVKNLRGIGLTYLLMLDGVAYVTPGGGYAKSGNSFKALKLSNKAFNTLHEWQERFNSEADDVVREMEEQKMMPGEPPTFKLKVWNNWFCSAIEYTARTKIDMGYLLGDPH